jgi:hypothetical protein
MNHSWPNYWLFFYRCPYTYTIDLFFLLILYMHKEWSKLVIKTTRGENSYCLCFWHQWPFGVSKSWFQKFINKSKLIQSIIYKKTSSSLAFEVLSKLNIQGKFPQKNSFWFLDQKNLSCDIPQTILLSIYFQHQNTFFCKFN